MRGLSSTVRTAVALRIDPTVVQCLVDNMWKKNLLGCYTYYLPVSPLDVIVIRITQMVLMYSWIVMIYQSQRDGHTFENMIGWFCFFLFIFSWQIFQKAFVDLDFESLFWFQNWHFIFFFIHQTKNSTIFWVEMWIMWLCFSLMLARKFPMFNNIFIK